MNCQKKVFLAFVLLFGLVATLKVPLKPNQFRCMLVYSTGEDQSVKIDMNLPKTNSWSESDYYYVSLRNTITDKYEQQTVSHGIYRRQIHLKTELIYEICFELVTDSSANEEIVVDYSAETHFILNHDQIKVPQHLLKIHQVQGTYRNAVLLSELADNFLNLQTKRYDKQEKYFQQTSGNESNITYISIVEILMILAISAYQFFTVKKYLTATPGYTEIQ